MAQAELIRGNTQTIDYTAGGAVAAGEVIVQGDLLGVAHEAAVSGDKISLMVDGVFKVTKITSGGGSSGALTAGEAVWWDDSANNVTDAAASLKLFGITTESAIAGDTTVTVLMNQFSSAASGSQS
tara:strand:- start:776 stop:1153 length:378 start_codon:yes stop_codon:yes gene_type:complete